MTSHDADTDSPAAVTVRCRDDHAVAVRLLGPFRPEDDRVLYAVEACAPGLTARVDDVAAWPWGADLPRFLAELAADFQGWDGRRVWQTLDRDLTVGAVFRSGGHVGLTWTLRPWRAASGRWEASVTTWLDAGEQMAALAADVRALLR